MGREGSDRNAGRRTRPARHAAAAAAALVGLSAATVAMASDRDAPAFPVGERLQYSVRWLGIRCGSMTLESYSVPDGIDTHDVIVMTASSSSLFDGIYRVRTRIESRSSRARASSVRFSNVSDERHRVREEVYEFDLDAGVVRRTRDGVEQRFALASEHVHDPLAYLFRLRAVEARPGESMSMVLATSSGPLRTTARVTEAGSVRTALGRHQAVRVVPEPEEGMLFRRSGTMAIWVGLDERRTPYRVEFDLSFGTLVAVLEAREPVGLPSDAVAH